MSLKVRTAVKSMPSLIGAFGIRTLQDRRAGDRRVHRDHLALRVEAGLHPHDARGAVEAVLHVLFARPHHLHRHAGHRLGDRHALPHEVLRAAAAAETAAQHHLVHLDLLERQAGRLRRGRHRRLAVLRRRPHLQEAVRLEPRGARLRLHRRVVEVRRLVFGLDHLRRGGESRLRVPQLARLRQLRVGEALRAASPRWSRLSALPLPAAVPLDSSPSSTPRWRATSCRRRRRRSPPRARPSSRRASFQRRAASRLATLPPNTGHCAIEACSIPGSVTSTPKTGLPRTLSGMSRRCSGLPAIFQSLGSRSVTSFGGVELGRGGGHLP